MIRLGAVLCFAVASLGVGFSAAVNVRNRRAVLSGFSRLFSDISAILKHKNMPLRRIYADLEPENYPGIEDFVADLRGFSQDGDLILSWRKATGRLPSAITASERQTISNLGVGLGSHAAKELESELEYIQEWLAKIRAEADEKCAKVSGLYTNLGVLCALAFAVLLL